MDQVAKLSAPIPDGYAFDSDQRLTFKTPQKLDAYFNFKDIRPAYIENINRLLLQIQKDCSLHELCIANACGREIIEQADVLMVQVHVDYATILMDVIAIRPCFAGYKLFLVVVYVLVRGACETGKTLIAQRCYPKTLEILKRYFEGLMRYDPYSQSPNCIFDNHRLLHAKITPSWLGIQDLITENEQGHVQLIDSAFPSASDLNDPVFVNAHYRAPKPKSFSNKRPKFGFNSLAY